jgi:septum site-determining protein MinD
VLWLENRIVYDLVDAIEGRCRVSQAMIRDKRIETLYLIPAAQTRDKNAVSPSDMIKLCDNLRAEMDWIIIDSPAGIERGFRNAIAPADEVLVITNPEVSAVRDADRIIGLVEAEERGPVKLVINRLKSAMVKRGDMLSAEDVVDLLAIPLLGIVPEDENVIVSTNQGQPVVMDTKSLAGRSFTNIAKRLKGEDVPWLDLTEKDGLFNRLGKIISGGG